MRSRIRLVKAVCLLIFYVLTAASAASAGAVYVSADQLGPARGSLWVGTNGVKDYADFVPEPTDPHYARYFPDLKDQDSRHPQKVLAAALVYAKGPITYGSYRTKVIDGLTAIVGTEGPAGKRAGGAESLDLGRNLAAYVVAASLIGYRGENFSWDTWLRGMRDRPNDDTGLTEFGRTLKDCHQERPNNWGTMCGASRAAIDLYLGETADMQDYATNAGSVKKVFRGFAGDRAWWIFPDYDPDAFSYSCVPGAIVPINPKDNCTIGSPSGDMGGSIVDDDRRCTDTSNPGVCPNDNDMPFTSFPPPNKLDYHFGSLSGLVGQAAMEMRRSNILHATLDSDDPTWFRYRLSSFLENGLPLEYNLRDTPGSLSKSALYRAYDYGDGLEYPLSSAARWATSVLNYYGAPMGLEPYPVSSASGGRLFAFGAFTHPANLLTGYSSRFTSGLGGWAAENGTITVTDIYSQQSQKQSPTVTSCSPPSTMGPEWNPVTQDYDTYVNYIPWGNTLCIEPVADTNNYDGYVDPNAPAKERAYVDVNITGAEVGEKYSVAFWAATKRDNGVPGNCCYANVTMEERTGTVNPQPQVMANSNVFIQATLRQPAGNWSSVTWKRIKLSGTIQSAGRTLLRVYVGEDSANWNYALWYESNPDGAGNTTLYIDNVEVRPGVMPN